MTANTSAAEMASLIWVSAEKAPGRSLWGRVAVIAYCSPMIVVPVGGILFDKMPWSIFLWLFMFGGFILYGRVAALLLFGKIVRVQRMSITRHGVDIACWTARRLGSSYILTGHHVPAKAVRQVVAYHGAHDTGEFDGVRVVIDKTEGLMTNWPISHSDKRTAEAFAAEAREILGLGQPAVGASIL